MTRHDMIRTFATAAFAACFAPLSLAGHAEVVPPPPSLVLDGIPPISTELAKKLHPYGEFRPHGLWSWHPTKREMLVRRRLNATNQVHLVTAPGMAPEPLTEQSEAIAGADYQPTRGDSFLFSQGEGGNEIFQIYRYDFATRTPVQLTKGKERALGARWNDAGDRIVYSTQPVDRHNPDRVARTTVRLMDPLKPENDRVLAVLEGGGWGAFRFSPDSKRLVFLERKSVNERHLWIMDVATGKTRRITKEQPGEQVAYGSARFARDGKGVFTTSDRGSEFQRLVYLPLAGGKERVLTAHLNYDVDSFEVSFAANMIAFTTNESGSNVLRFMDLRTLKELPRPPLMHGVMGGLEWRPGSAEVGFHITSARSAGDVFSYEFKTNRLTRWTNGNNPDVNTSEFAEPRIVKWKSFDGLEVSGFHYQPPARFTGKRPVIVNIHGGPEAQARPGFLGRNNYFVSELGIAMIYPNVRGSAGFGKTFLKLDNGVKREDSVKDIGALLDWIRQQPDLDADRVIVIGGSYGGYMTLACAFHFPDRLAGAVSSVGISNFVTFLERTESYRRDLRRVEYGDERDPQMRAFLESIAPLRNADKMSKPLFVVHGLNDPRVPYTEAEQIVRTLKERGRPAWFMLAKDEGHGFAKKPNADYQFYALVEFAKKTLLE